MKDIDFKEIDEKANKGELTDKDVDQILNTIREASKENSDLKILNNIKSNPLKPGEEGTVGGYIKAQVKLDPVTGEKINLTEDEALMSKDDSDKSLLDMVNDLARDKKITTNITITAQDIIDKTPIIFNIPEDLQEEYKITEEEAQRIVDLIYKINIAISSNIYSQFPEPIRKLIDITLKKQGYVAKNPHVNAIRNNTCVKIITAYITTITKEKHENTLVKLMEDIEKSDNISVCNVMNDYDNHKKELLEALRDVIDNNPKKKEEVEKILSAMKDAYDMTRLIEYAPKCKLRSIDIEKPQSRIFNTIESKYRYHENLHCPALSSVHNILMRHNHRSVEDNLKFFLVLSKACMNYNIEDYSQHMFIHTVLRNIIYLDIYKDDKHENIIFTSKLLENINKVIDSTK